MTVAAKKTAVFPGSFDPPTLGHLDLFERAATLFDRLVVGVLENPSKSAALLKSPARCELIAAELELRGVSSVEVQVFEGLAVDFAGSVGASWIVRGLRSAADLGSESAMAATNRDATGGAIDTVFIPASPRFVHIQSRLVREIASGGGDITAFVSPAVAAAVRKALLP